MKELTKDQVDTLCKPGKGNETCSFIVVQGGHMCCGKGTDFERTLRSLRSDMTPKGDNCSGPPDFKPNAGPQANAHADKSNRELWQEIVARVDLIGGDLEAREGEDIFRGPIKSISIGKDQVIILTEWSAVRFCESQHWEKHHVTRVSFGTDDSQPSTDITRQVHFYLPFVGSFTLSTKGKDNLSPLLVKGLELSSTR